jgi:4-azaleucine resistance transporter AzlC
MSRAQVSPALAPRRTPTSLFLAGVRRELPILLGVMPFGMIYGALAQAAGLPFAAAQGMSAIVFAGSSQFVAAQLFAGGAPLAVIVLTIAVVNLRHALYSASLAPYVRHLSWRWKAVLAYLLTDEAYAVTVLHYQEPGVEPTAAPHHFYYLGAGLALWSTWQASTAAGLFLGAQIPPSWSLDFTLALTFIALIFPALRDRPAVAATLSAGFVAVAAYALPYKLGLLLAAAVGIGVGLLLEGVHD